MRLRELVTIKEKPSAYGQLGAIEIIVADNQSSDATAEIARARGCLVATVEKRVIGAVRNGGAALAQGEILALIDADMQVHEGIFSAMDTALATSRCIGGASGVRMERMSLGLALTYAAMLPMVWLTGMDTGVVFCRRADFLEIGGYDESRLVAEDVMFLVALRRLGRIRKQKLFRLRQAKAIVSTRKFDEFGDWHYFGLLWQGFKQLRRKGDASFTDRYWYKPKR